VSVLLRLFGQTKNVGRCQSAAPYVAQKRQTQAILNTMDGTRGMRVEVFTWMEVAHRIPKVSNARKPKS
jgi:hypothetical protein